MITVRSPPGSYGAVRRAWSVPAPARRQLPTGAVTARAGTCRPLPRSGGAHRGEELPWAHTVPDIVLTRTSRRSWRPTCWPASPTRCGRRRPHAARGGAARPGPVLHGAVPGPHARGRGRRPRTAGEHAARAEQRPAAPGPAGQHAAGHPPAPHRHPGRRAAGRAAGPRAAGRQPWTARSRASPRPAPHGAAPDGRTRGHRGERAQAPEVTDQRALSCAPARPPSSAPDTATGTGPRRTCLRPGSPATRRRRSPSRTPRQASWTRRGRAASGSPPWAASRSTPPCPRR